jgi:hypothetical protein
MYQPLFLMVLFLKKTKDILGKIARNNLQDNLLSAN